MCTSLHETFLLLSPPTLPPLHPIPLTELTQNHNCSIYIRYFWFWNVVFQFCKRIPKIDNKSPQFLIQKIAPSIGLHAMNSLWTPRALQNVAVRSSEIFRRFEPNWNANLQVVYCCLSDCCRCVYFGRDIWFASAVKSTQQYTNQPSG